MPMKVYYSETSPLSLGVLMVLKRLDIKCDLESVNLFAGEQRSPKYLEINPRGKVPALIDGDFTLSESRAIAAYLCNKYGAAEETLYPKDPEKRAKVDMMLYVGEWIHLEIEDYLNVTNVFTKDEKTRDENLPKLHEAFKQLENYLEKDKFMTGPNITIADFFGLNSILYLGLNEFDDYGKYPKMVEWMKEMKKLKCYAEVNRAGMENFGTLFRGKLLQNAK